jgi:hypothetical protein
VTFDRMAAGLSAEIVAGICFVGRSSGAVKLLDGFRKGHHRVPDAANEATHGFLARICEPALQREAEALFQTVRSKLGYKRTQLSLAMSPALAVLTSGDFTLEIAYALDANNPANYSVTQTLLHLRSAEIAQTEDFATIFAGMFSEISFGLKKSVPVEAVIDAIEELDGDDGLRVDYPADCRDCRISMPGVEAEMLCDGTSLDMVFTRPGSPRELMAEFDRVRSAFALSPELAALIG